jgi:hypothetical protein
MKKKEYIRKRYMPPAVYMIILSNIDDLLRRSVKIVVDDEDEFEEEIEGSTNPARAKGIENWAVGLLDD